MANEPGAVAVRRQRDVQIRAGRMLGACLLGLAVLLGGEQGSLAQSDSQPVLFPNMTEAYVPRGSAQLLKPYLPKPEGETSDYRFVVETPKHLAFVVAAKGFGIAPREVKVEPAPAREGVEYTRNVLLYDAYPAGGFELSLCWQDAAKHTIAYQPAIQAGGTFDWMHLARTVTAPADAAFVRPLIIKWQNRGIRGTFWVDNVAFRAADGEENLVEAGTFDEPVWKSGYLKPEGKDGGKCAKFVCPAERALQQQALWVDPEQDPISVREEREYVVELDLKTDGLGVPGDTPIAALLFRADEAAPEGRALIFTYVDGSDEKRCSELVILPPLRNVRPKRARIAPCHYGTTFPDPEVAQAYAENCWRSGITWTYGSLQNNVVAILGPRGHRVWLAKPGEPFAARGPARDFLEEHPELRAIGFDAQPKSHLFCPTWLLSAEGAEMRRIMDDELVELVDRDGYTAVNWDIEQPVIPETADEPDRGFCLCPRCLAAFRAAPGIAADAKLDAESICGQQRPAWIDFRCRQNAELAGHAAKALKRCARPIEFSVYSGYQGERTRGRYGVDWGLLAPHLDLAIAGYGGTRAAIRETLAALGEVPFIGGEMYYLSPTPRPGAPAWQQAGLKRKPAPHQWRNRLLRQYVDSGGHGVLIWYLPTMEGGAFYYTSEAAEIIAAHEEIFEHGTRCDERFQVAGLKPEHWAALEHGERRLLLLLNFSDDEAPVQVRQPDAAGRPAVSLFGTSDPLSVDPKEFEIRIPPWGTKVLTFAP